MTQALYRSLFQIVVSYFMETLTMLISPIVSTRFITVM